MISHFTVGSLNLSSILKETDWITGATEIVKLLCLNTHYGTINLKTASFQPQSNLSLLLTLCSSQYPTGKEPPSASISNNIYREYSREGGVLGALPSILAKKSMW